MNSVVQLLIVVDGRIEMPDAEAIAAGTVLSTDSIVGLPLKREALHRWAAENGIEVRGEVVVEVEPDVDPEFFIESTVHRLRQNDALHVLTLDRALIDDAAGYEALQDAGQVHGLAFHDVNPPLSIFDDTPAWTVDGESTTAPFSLHLAPH